MLAVVKCIDNNNSKVLKLGGNYIANILQNGKCVVNTIKPSKYIGSFKSDRFQVVRFDSTNMSYDIGDIMQNKNINKVFKVINHDIIVKNDGEKLVAKYLHKTSLWEETYMSEEWFGYKYVLSSDLTTFEEAIQKGDLIKYRDWNVFYNTKGALNRLYEKLENQDIRYLLEAKVWIAIDSKSI